MFGRRFFVPAAAAATVTLALAAAAFAQSNAPQTSNAKEIMSLPPAKLVAILQDANATVFQKAKACQRLAVVGSKDAIPALAALLPDETLNLYARFGLERIADPAVDDALREAATKLQGRQLVGVIDSIGQRKDAGAVPLLKGLLGNAEGAVASAAAGALGRIGTSTAAGILREGLAKDSPARIAVADASLACAEGLAAAGKKEEALALFQAVATTNLPKYFQVAALGGQFRIFSREGGGKEPLLAQIRSPEPALFNLGLAVARELPGSDVTTALTGELDKLPAERQALLLRALGDRQEPVPLASLLSASKSPATPVREAAIRVLATRSDPAALTVLLAAAVGEGDAAQVAKEGLKNLAGRQVDQAILGKLAAADPKTKIVLLEIAGARGISAAEPTVRQALADQDKALRLAALAALGQLIDLKDLDLLIARALGGGDKQERAAAQEALNTAAQRMSDREACAAKLAASLKGAAEADQAYLLELLGRVSGRKALETVVAQVHADNPALKDAATKVLGDWPNADAADALLDIAKNDPEAKYRTRALRGYIRIGRQLQLSDEARIAMFHTAMATATRDEEKQIALDILSRIPSEATLQLAVSHLGQAALKSAAADAAVKIASELAASNPKAVAAAMQKVVDAKVRGKSGTRANDLLEQAKAGSK